MRLDHDKLTDREVFQFIRAGIIKFAGSKSAKIYGSLHCESGKKMKRENRTFFNSEETALYLGYRPCAKCMKEKYDEWKRGKKFAWLNFEEITIVKKGK